MVSRCDANMAFDWRTSCHNALLAKEPEKWSDLKNKIDPTCPHWNKELLKFRQEAMLAATSERNEGRLDCQFYCRY